MSNKCSEVVQLCREMVAVGSVNPQDKAVSDDVYGEERMAELVLGWLAGHGLDAELQTVTPGRTNVVAWAAGVDGAKTLLLTGHTDTVDIKDMTVEPFDAAVRDGRLYGRGACDTKGPLAAMMIAFRDRVRAGQLPCNLVFLATCDEEYGMSGSRYYAKHTTEPLAGGVFAEPTGLQTVVAHKGALRLRMRSKGRSCHGSSPQLGANAIYGMARAVLIAERYAETLGQRQADELLGLETLAVTMVNGGQQINVIPDSCQATIDWRVLPGRKAEQCRAELAEVLAAEGCGGIDVELLNDFAPMATDADSGLVAGLLAAAKRAGAPGNATAWAGATDAGSFVNVGIPTPIFGPGGVEQAHTPDEYIEISQLEKGVAAYGYFLAGDWGI